MNEIWERLKEARTKVGLSTTKVSKLTKISEGNLSELESGAHQPSTKTLLRLSEVYGVSIDWLLKGKVNQGFETSEKNKDFVEFLRSILAEWEQSDEETQGWITVQLKKALPELAEKVKKSKEK